MAVLRLTETGAWDTTYGYQGIYKSPVNTTVTTVHSTASVEMLRFLPDGNLAVAGMYYRTDTNLDLPYPGAPSHPSPMTTAVWATRLNPDGNVDITYGTDGYAERAQTNEVFAGRVSTGDSYWVQPMTITADGRIYGVITINPSTEDSSGGSNFRIEPSGRTTVNDVRIAPTSFEQIYGIKKIDGPIAVQEDGKVIARRGGDPVLFRSNLDNTIDTSFGVNGFVTFSEPSLSDVQIAPDGSILAITPGSGKHSFKLHRLFRDEAPLAQFDAPFVKAPRSTAVRLPVTYRDDDAVDPGTIDSLDIRVTGPFDGGTRPRAASLESVTPLDGGRFLAIYKVTSPNGWTAVDNGIYTVRINAWAVSDTNGVAAGSGTLGTFRVKISK